jgi:pyruvate dehydrogenase E1 component alpha subunit
MPGELVNGNDPDDVLNTALELASMCRDGRGPALMELTTYRMHGHGEYDKQHYVDPAEIEFWAERDPIVMFSSRLEQEGVLGEGQAEAMRREAADKVAEALKFADESPYPAPEAALEHVWASPEHI